MTFVHQDEGTAEADWAAAIERMRGELRQVGPEFFADVAHLVVVSAHPDDETLGCGGLIARATARGETVHTLFVTDGGASHLNSRAWPRARLGARREAEAEEALRRLGAGAPPPADLRRG